MKTVHFVVPEGIDDPARPSGGNTYDRHVSRELGRLGWSVYEHAVPGRWPRPDAEALAALAGLVERIPDGALALLDGLIASTAPEVLVPHALRLRLVVLVHMALGHRPGDDAVNETRRRELAVLRAATTIVTTSQWSRARLLGLYQLAPDRLHVAPPGVETAELSTGTVHGRSFICVAAVSFEKGHDVLLEALLAISEQSWQCRCVGALDRDPVFVEELRRRAVDGGLTDRVSFPGPRTGADLERSYAAADVTVLASRAETYGMVVAEALARGLPVIATDVGGVTEALGYGAGGIRPGLLIPPEDPAALGAALRAWLGDAELRRRLQLAASQRRESLPGWSTTASALSGALAEVLR